ncbi:uncharacterized protein LTR77_001945 [Saxophila tyrrhenica]|uniref:Uncharacterized protein n=1 Tax=Saxophila tyrrhenica TaxID=1690608 RepID=A0AAV9PH52_9PEZI|nr:hypothetical protein LTR77_001945 [Saxophila tyrrhenica]
MKWNAETDFPTLIRGFGREIRAKEHANIALLYPEQPTTKSVQERVQKLRTRARAAHEADGHGIQLPASSFRQDMTAEERVAAAARLLREVFEMGAGDVQALAAYMRGMEKSGLVGAPGEDGEGEGGDDGGDGDEEPSPSDSRPPKRQRTGTNTAQEGLTTTPVQEIQRQPERQRIDLSTLRAEVVEAARDAVRAEAARQAQRAEDEAVELLIYQNHVEAARLARMVADAGSPEEGEGVVEEEERETVEQARAGKRRTGGDGEGGPAPRRGGNSGDAEEEGKSGEGEGVA